MDDRIWFISCDPTVTVEARNEPPDLAER